MKLVILLERLGDFSISKKSVCYHHCWILGICTLPVWGRIFVIRVFSLSFIFSWIHIGIKLQKDWFTFGFDYKKIGSHSESTTASLVYIRIRPQRIRFILLKAYTWQVNRTWHSRKEEGVIKQYIQVPFTRTCKFKLKTRC